MAHLSCTLLGANRSAILGSLPTFNSIIFRVVVLYVCAEENSSQISPPSVSLIVCLSVRFFFLSFFLIFFFIFLPSFPRVVCLQRVMFWRLFQFGFTAPSLLQFDGNSSASTCRLASGQCRVFHRQITWSLKTG